MKQKHYIDIDNLREQDTELRFGNCHGFKVGDIISITEKIDGSNLSLAYDAETGSIRAFSRKQELEFNNGLNGAWEMAQNINLEPFKKHPSWRVFGEWSGTKNKILYDDRFRKKWIVFDIFDVNKDQWLLQDDVKTFCKEVGLEYIHELYYGPFVSWEHCRSFLNSPSYGEKEEGVVVKNMTMLNNPNTRLPFYLKIVNDDFKESMKIREKKIDPEMDEAKREAQKIVDSIVTKNRVEKLLFKMRDDGVIPERLEPTDMKYVASSLPRRCYEDCVKEEKELVDAAGEYFGKLCSATAMRWARKIIVGE